MTRIISSALRPLRLHAAATANRSTCQSQLSLQLAATRGAATYSNPSAPSTAAGARKPVSTPQSSYKRSATTSTSSSSSSSPSAKPTTSAYAENQVNPVAAPPYQPPPGAGPLPEAPAHSSFAGNGNGPSNNGIDWSSSFHGLSTIPFSPEVAAVLMKAIPFDDVEIKPDGIIYLPEIKYRRILNTAFGPGGWGMAPRGDLAVGEKVVTREYALLVHGRFIAQARGECGFFGNDDGIATAGEGCKSNALMRCCKDLGIASELWDPRYIREFKKKYTHEIWVEHVATKKKRQIWVRKGDDPQYPYKKSGFGA